MCEFQAYGALALLLDFFLHQFIAAAGNFCPTKAN